MRLWAGYDSFGAGDSFEIMGSSLAGFGLGSFCKLRDLGNFISVPRQYFAIYCGEKLRHYLLSRVEAYWKIL